MAAFSLIVTVVCALYCLTIPTQADFFNPISDQKTVDPNILKLENWYYLTLSTGTEILMYKSRYLSDFRNAEFKTIYTLPPGYTIVYSARLHLQHGSLYMYLDMANSTLRTCWVSTALDSKDPMCYWTAPKAIRSKQTAVGQILIHNTQTFFVWSAYDSNFVYQIYIAPMKNPMEIESDHPDILLYTPSESWECAELCYSVATSFIYNRGVTYLIYFTIQGVNSSTSYLSIQADTNPLLPSNWERAEGPLFTGSDTEKVYKAYYTTFTQSPDNTELWMLYGATDNVSVSVHTPRIERVKFNVQTGAPEFAVAHGAITPQLEPSGERPMFTNPISNVDMYLPTIYRNPHQYYIVFVDESNTGFEICSSKEPTYFDCADKTTVFSLPSGYTNLHMGKIHEVDGELYMYSSFRPENGTQNLYVLKANNNSDPKEGWSSHISVLEDIYAEETSHYSPDILMHDSKLYLVWEFNNSIYIAEMYNATKALGPPVLIKVASEAWSCDPTCTIGAPSAINHGNITFLAYSASSYYSAQFCMSYLSIQSGRDPLDATSWMPALYPAFSSNIQENVYGPGHGSFFLSADRSERWLVYVSSSTANNITRRRKPSIELVRWDSNSGYPIFPTPHGANHKQPVPSVAKYFVNPVIETPTKTSSILKIGPFYYLTAPRNDNRELVIFKSGQLTNFTEVEERIVYRVPSGYSNINSPQLHVINGEVYLYFSMQNSSQIARIFAIKADISEDPMASWSTATRIMDNVWDLESTYPTLASINQKLYLIWRTPNPHNRHNSIYVAEMENATTPSSSPVLLREPVDTWECVDKCDLSAPTVLSNGNKHFLVYSASPSCSDGYALGWLSIEDGKDPLDGINWSSAAGPFFQADSTEDVFCPGHVIFTTSPDNQESWMAYHATNNKNDTVHLNVRIEKIKFDERGNPTFPKPHGSSTPQLIPSAR